MLIRRGEVGQATGDLAYPGNKGGKVKMKFKLGQEVKYRKISKKIKINRHFWTPEDFEQDEEKILERRELIELDKGRIGYIAGRRKLVFQTIFSLNYDSYDVDNDILGFVDIVRQEEKFAYLVAYTMGKTNYVLEEDLNKEK